VGYTFDDGLDRAGRADKGRHRLPDELLKGDRGHGPSQAAPQAAEVHRAAVKIAAEQGWKAPSYPRSSGMSLIC